MQEGDGELAVAHLRRGRRGAKVKGELPGVQPASQAADRGARCANTHPAWPSARCATRRRSATPINSLPHPHQLHCRGEAPAVPSSLCLWLIGDSKAGGLLALPRHGSPRVAIQQAPCRGDGAVRWTARRMQWLVRHVPRLASRAKDPPHNASAQAHQAAAHVGPRRGSRSPLNATQRPSCKPACARSRAHTRRHPHTHHLPAKTSSRWSAGTVCAPTTSPPSLAT